MSVAGGVKVLKPMNPEDVWKALEEVEGDPLFTEGAETIDISSQCPRCGSYNFFRHRDAATGKVIERCLNTEDGFTCGYVHEH